jgi:hypothetical protein
LAGKAHASKASFLAPPRTHTGGQVLSFVLAWAGGSKVPKAEGRDRRRRAAPLPVLGQARGSVRALRLPPHSHLPRRGGFELSRSRTQLYNHAGFICGMPVGSGARAAWSPAAVRYIRDAGLLYRVGLRQMVLVVPVVVSLYHPLAGTVTAAVVVGGLLWLDRTQRAG